MSFDIKSKKIGFIGVGNMASAIIGGITSSGQCPWQNIYLYDISSAKTEEFRKNGAIVVD